MARKIDPQHEAIYNELCEFIKNYSLTPGSWRNYTDFARINECINLVLHADKEVTILDYQDPFEFAELEKKLNKNEKYKQYNKKGNNQYANAILMYRNFLFARKYAEMRKNTVAAPLMPTPLPDDLPLQLIVYGAPGTGKSYGIEQDIAKYHMRDVRTTFHPDSDYSTFVGAYKPQMQKVRKCVILDKEEKEIKPSVTKQEYESKIVYKYSKQAFLKSYVAAWKDIKNPHVLVIEEMNRGNCAQIFGDIFQLLDRNDAGFSRYPIDADADVMQELNEEFEGLTLEDADAINALYKDDVVDYIISGEKLVLPNNLYIWATMNTSDQSLFPIDSAFKRRWSQRYVPISDAGKGWVISVNGNEYDWWSFVSLINSKIWDATHSEDKKLGYFFCQANSEGVITAKDFVGKVIFFIYNDVFKDSDFADNLFVDETDSENPDLLFKDFFMPDGNPNEKKLDVFMQNLEVKLKSEAAAKPDEEDTDNVTVEDEEVSSAEPASIEDDIETKGNDYTKYSFDGQEGLGKGKLAVAVIEKYIAEHPELSFDELKETFPDSMMGDNLKLMGLIVKAPDVESATYSYKKKAYGYFDKTRRMKDANGVEFFVSNYWNITNIQSIIDFAVSQGWTVEAKK